MKILNIQNAKERAEAIELCKNLLEKRALIPVIGAGFSIETQTDNNGRVPSVNDLYEKLFFYIEKYSGYNETELKEIKKYSLSGLAGVFWNIYNKIPTESLGSFYSYINANFNNISFRKGFQEAFLGIQWPYMFTLNYDSLIEDYSRRYYPVIPYNKINRYFSNDKTKIYKLHGDAKKYIETADKRYFIISKDQYIESMMDEANKDMLNELLTAFLSKSIIFFGCSLSEELDLLYSSQLAIKDKVKNIDPNQQSIIYISFEKEENASSSDFSALKQDKLAQYGVTHVLRIFSEYESEEFFNDLSKVTAYIPQPGLEAYLEKYTALQYKTLNTDDTTSRDFLFQENLIWKSIDVHTIIMPSYCISRSKIIDAKNSISNGEPLCFVSGNFFSGKTYFLIEIAKYFMSKKVYIFPSGTTLTFSQLDLLLKKENSLLCFDSKSLTTSQIKMICTEKKIDELKKIKSSALIVIDASDAPMYKYIFEARNSSREFQQFWISGSLDDQEEAEFNKKIGTISLPPYSKNETLLDYIVHNEKELIAGSNINDFFLKPQTELLNLNAKKKIKALIMLSTEIRISAKRAIQFDIDSAINDIIKDCKKHNDLSVIEKDFSVYNGDSSGYEFVCNSKYWIIHILSTYAQTEKDSIDVIADSYLSIIQDYKNIYKDDDVKFYQNSEPYYFYDHIQTLFNYRWLPNSSKLTNKIYDKLMSVLSNSYQFLHQKAKGKLRTAQIQIKNGNNDDAKILLKDAIFNITRAVKLAEQYPEAKNIDETLLHMTYTEGRIRIEYSCICYGHTPQAVDTCCRLYQIQQNIRNDAYDFITGNGNDKKSFEKFKNMLISNKTIHNFKDFDSKKAEFLLKRWTGKKFIIRKNKKNKN